jgi:3-hydroxymyristoyl/3-hydroxydecanoyl-(acyl carrier protein) dehydratase
MNARGPASVEVECRIDAALPAFDGHFPGAPVLPGAHLLALVIDTVARQPALAQRVGTAPLLQQVKFLAAVQPGQTLHIRLDDTASGIAFAIRCGAVPVARGQFAAAAAAPPQVRTQ